MAGPSAKKSGLLYRRGLAFLGLAAAAAVAACAAPAGTGSDTANDTSSENAAVAKDDGKGATSDPFGVTLTSAEIAAGDAWEASGDEESDVDVDDGDTTAEFEKLPLASDDDDAGVGSLLEGSSLTTSALDIDLEGTSELSTQGLVSTSGSALLCRPTTAVRQAACWAAGKYRGNIKVAQMDGKIVEVTVYCQVQKGKEIAKKAGKTLTVNSGWRSVDSQRRLYALYKAGRGNVAAPPGRSHHNCGHAIDFAGSARTSGWLRSNAPKFNFQYVAIKGETWHFENWSVGPKVPR